MLTTLRRDRRARRQANFTLESLDERLVLSAGAGGAAAAEAAKVAATEHRHEVQVARHEAKLATREARAEAKAHRMEARAEAKAARAAAKAGRPTMPAVPAPVNPIVIGAPTSGSTGGAAGSGGAAPADLTAATAPTTTASPAIATTGSGTGSDSSSTGSSSSGPLPSNVAAALQSLYQEYEGQGGGDSFTPGQPSDSFLDISGTSVDVSLKISGTDFNTALSQLQADGMQVNSSSAAYGVIQGMLPIGELPAAAQVASSVTPISPPHLS
jgi:biotin operon repressor